MICWLPYAFVCIYRTLWGATGLALFQMTLPAMFAKSSMTLPPLFYIVFNKRIQQAFFMLLNIKKENYLNSKLDCFIFILEGIEQGFTSKTIRSFLP